MGQAIQTDFSGQSIYVGIDVHKKSWQVSIYTTEFEHKTFNQPPDPLILVGYLHRVFPGGSYQAVYEAGFSGFWAYDALKEQGVDCIVVHPGDVPTTDKERRRKSDSRDSRKLARQLRGGDLDAIHVPSAQLREDRSLVRQRRTVCKDLTRVKNRIRQALHFHGIRIPPEMTDKYWSGHFIAWLKALVFDQQTGRKTLDALMRQLEFLRDELACLNREIRTLSRAQRYRDHFNRLMKIKGIGMLSAMAWLTELGDVRRFKNLDRLSSYIGLVPWEHSSGEHEHRGGLDRRGNKVLRTLLIENAWIAVRKDPELLAAYQRYTKRMKGQQAIIRIARKLLGSIRHAMLGDVNTDMSTHT